jgi:hypothetical protein
VVAAVPFGLAWGWMTGLGVVASSVTGALFGIGMASFMVAARRRLVQNPPTVPGEHVIFHSPANHFRGGEGVGGWLVLTDNRLLFRPHKFNVQTGDWSVSLDEVQRLEPRPTAWVIPNGLLAVTDHGEERFVVEERARWVDEFRSIQKASG